MVAAQILLILVQHIFIGDYTLTQIQEGAFVADVTIKALFFRVGKTLGAKIQIGIKYTGKVLPAMLDTDSRSRTAPILS
jgi:hypothetical protein